LKVFGSTITSDTNPIQNLYKVLEERGHVVVRFTTTYAISAYPHWCCEFKSRSWRGAQFVFLSFFFWRTLYYLSFYLWCLVTTVVSGIVYPPEPPNSLVAYSEIRVVQSLVFWTIVYLFVHFRQLCCLFFFDIYGFWLSIWYLFLKVKRIYENINLIYFQKIPNRNLLN
jgi:hypothetical protein